MIACSATKPGVDQAHSSLVFAGSDLTLAFACSYYVLTVTSQVKDRGWQRRPPSSTLTWMPFMPPSSNCSTPRSVANLSPSVVGLCLPLLTKPGPSGSAVACRD